MEEVESLSHFAQVLTMQAAFRPHFTAFCSTELQLQWSASCLFYQGNVPLNVSGGWTSPLKFCHWQFFSRCGDVWSGVLWICIRFDLLLAGTSPRHYFSEIESRTSNIMNLNTKSSGSFLWQFFQDKTESSRCCFVGAFGVPGAALCILVSSSAKVVSSAMACRGIRAPKGICFLTKSYRSKLTYVACDQSMSEVQLHFRGQICEKMQEQSLKLYFLWVHPPRRIEQNHLWKTFINYSFSFVRRFIWKGPLFRKVRAASPDQYIVWHRKGGVLLAYPRNETIMWIHNAAEEKDAFCLSVIMFCLEQSYHTVCLV